MVVFNYRTNKVDYDKAYDARVWAPVPNTRKLSAVSTTAFLYSQEGKLYKIYYYYSNTHMAEYQLCDWAAVAPTKLNV